MNGVEWMERLMDCPQARRRIPLELQMTIPLPGRRAEHTVECWYYRLETDPAGNVNLDSPELYVLWDSRTMEILNMESMKPERLGSGKDLLTREHREKEDAFLNGAFTTYLETGAVQAEEALKEWLEAAPQEMREWFQHFVKEVK